jgi:hypothetical protein
MKIYKTAIEEHSSQFDKKVNDLLAQGWELYGSPYGVTEGEDGYLCQALVINDGKEAQG